MLTCPTHRAWFSLHRPVPCTFDLSTFIFEKNPKNLQKPVKSGPTDCTLCHHFSLLVATKFPFCHFFKTKDSECNTITTPSISCSLSCHFLDYPLLRGITPHLIQLCPPFLIHESWIYILFPVGRPFKCVVLGNICQKFANANIHILYFWI